jgi:hypothetical protein
MSTSGNGDQVHLAPNRKTPCPCSPSVHDSIFRKLPSPRNGIRPAFQRGRNNPTRERNKGKQQSAPIVLGQDQDPDTLDPPHPSQAPHRNNRWSSRRQRSSSVSDPTPGHTTTARQQVEVGGQTVKKIQRPAVVGWGGGLHCRGTRGTPTKAPGEAGVMRGTEAASMAGEGGAAGAVRDSQGGQRGRVGLLSTGAAAPTGTLPS